MKQKHELTVLKFIQPTALLLLLFSDVLIGQVLIRDSFVCDQLICDEHLPVPGGYAYSPGVIYVDPRLQIKPLEEVRPDYPARAARRGLDGYVLVKFIIKEDGSVKDVQVIESTNEKFEESALKAANEFRYKPFIKNGEPVEKAYHYKFTFQLMQGGKLAEEFVTAYKDFRRQYNRENQSKIKPRLEKLHPYFQREEVYWNFANYLYSAKFEDNELMQINYLRGATTTRYNRDDEYYLPEKSINFALPRLFALQTKHGFLEESLDTYQKIKMQKDQSNIETYGPLYDEILSLKQSDQAYPVKLKINDAGFAAIELFRRSFYLTGSQDEIFGLKLKCDKRSADIPFASQETYEIPESWGACLLKVEGTPKASLEYTQL